MIECLPRNYTSSQYNSADNRYAMPAWLVAADTCLTLNDTRTRPLTTHRTVAALALIMFCFFVEAVGFFSGASMFRGRPSILCKSAGIATCLITHLIGIALKTSFSVLFLKNTLYISISIVIGLFMISHCLSCQRGHRNCILRA